MLRCRDELANNMPPDVKKPMKGWLLGLADEYV
jgi:hypothetical protein